MPGTFAHRTTLREEMSDFTPTAFASGYQGAFVAPDGPEGLEPGGGSTPLWWIDFDLPQGAIAESYGDGTVARDYPVPFSIWAESNRLEHVFALIGAELETYFAALVVSGWNFLTNQIAVRPGFASVGGFSGRTFDLPMQAS